MKKKKVLCIGLLCEFFACLYVPMSHNEYSMFIGYTWLWDSYIGNHDVTIVTIDIPRFIVGILAIAFLTAVGYIIAKNDKD